MKAFDQNHVCSANFISCVREFDENKELDDWRSPKEEEGMMIKFVVKRLVMNNFENLGLTYVSNSARIGKMLSLLFN